MSSPPPQKKQKSSPSGTSPRPIAELAPIQAPVAPSAAIETAPPPLTPTNSRKRSRASRSPKFDTLPPPTSAQSASGAAPIPALLREDSSKKKPRTNTPWTAQEEQTLKRMRDAGNSWGEIAKSFPNRTEGSVKKHWYKDMHYAEWHDDEVAALKEAIREYEANKWKLIGQKVGKPPKACEQYAKDNNLRNM